MAQETQAFHYHLESYRYWPVDMNVITWLGIYYVKQEMYEAAIPFFSRASQIEPNEVKWRLMVASCYRRHSEHLSHIDLKPGMGAYPAALKLYEDIHRSHPNDIECVRIPHHHLQGDETEVRSLCGASSEASHLLFSYRSYRCPSISCPSCL